MAERQVVETVYRGRRYSGEWWLEDGQLHVESILGSSSGPPVAGGPIFRMPSEMAERMLWELARKQDPTGWFRFRWD